MVDEPHDVDDLMRAVREAGGRTTKELVDAEFFEGRSAYFTDFEDNYWEIAWAPPDNPVVAAVGRSARESTRSQHRGRPVVAKLLVLVSGCSRDNVGGSCN